MTPNLISLVLGLPLLGFLILAFGGSAIEKALGRRALGFISVLPIFLAFLVGVGITLSYKAPEISANGYRAVLGSQSIVRGPEWISILGFRLPFEWIVDPLSMTMVLIITGIGSLIFLYSTGYMAEEREYSRFFTYLNLFVLSMLILVLGNNLALLFVGWEGVGLCSYLLIGFWYTDLANAKAANKAFVVNRIGDWGLTLGLFLIVATLVGGGAAIEGGRYLSYDTMLPELARILQANPMLATGIGLLLFVGAMGKSAQFPLYLWLPDAMAGPTPVSALIHAATMVTSGVVLLNRMHVVYELSSVASAVVCAIGAFTAIFAALIAISQTDIKKVLAYSTVSQLGFMFIGVGAGAYWAGMFHVTTHAFFKALLFLGAGAVIHAMAHDQDIRNYGGLLKRLPITGWTMIVGTLAIAAVGIPSIFGLSGFYSKEALLGAALANNHANLNGLNLSQIAGWVGLITAAITAFYMARMTILTFGGKEERWRNRPVPAHTTDEEDHAGGHHGLGPDFTPHEAPPSMTIPLVVLAILSAFGGFLLHQNGAFEKWLAPSSGTAVLGEVSVHPHGLPLEWISLGAALTGLVLGFLFYGKGMPKGEGWDETRWSPFRRASYGQFGFDSLMTTAAVEGGSELAQGIGTGVERSLIDGVVNGSAGLATTFGRGLGLVQRGFIRSYALLMLIGGVALLGYMAYAGMRPITTNNPMPEIDTTGLVPLGTSSAKPLGGGS
ncbi:NADH-quinone oxidoreductase subunit L [bacterium]|nr:MAG: NADH-quinone oxidoreductase subunit L [bacterium]